LPIPALSVAALRYDAGDNVKFNLPMAWSAGVLAWSLVDFEAGYKAAGEYTTALDSIKWVTDYFIKCVGDGKTDIVVQVRPWQGPALTAHSTRLRLRQRSLPDAAYITLCNHTATRCHTGSVSLAATALQLLRA
jgi:hypothetical protein